MGIEGLDYKIINIPLARGLKTKDDPRAMEPPGLAICSDARWDDWGGIQTRFPFLPLGNSIFGGGTLANVRRLEVVNDELVVFTDTQLYSWNAQLAKWVLRGTHLAVNITETPRFVTTGDQIDGDRAELNGTVVETWTEGGVVFVGATDKTTNAVLVPPFSLVAASTRSRVIALSTKLMLFFEQGGALVAIALDPADPSAALSGGPTVTVANAAAFNLFYDVVKVEGQDLAIGVYRRDTTTSYSVFTVSPALSVTTVTKARTADGPVAITTTPSTGLQAQVIRANGTNIQGDFLTTSTLADLTTGQAIGTGTGTVNQIAAAYRSVTTGGAFRCYAFWSSNENAGFATLFASKFNFVDTAGTIGTQANFVLGLGIGSRAFAYAGSVYVWLAFGKTSVFQGDAALTNQTQAQNAYVLYRDDAFLVSKAVYEAGAGFRATTGYLPGVALATGTATFAWIGTYRRRQLLGGNSTAFAARASRDIIFTFDANLARRCTVIGRTLYIAAGEVLQYDGVRLVEVGFHFYPYSFDMLKSGTGSVATGTYAYKLTWRYLNGQGESERSTTATIGIATMAGGPAGFAMGTASPLTVTHKTQVAGAVGIEVWRTVVNGTADVPFFLASNPDPNLTTAPNQYIANDPTATFAPAAGTWRDEMADATLTTKEANPENGSVLEALAPPAASIIFATDTRVFLAGIAQDPDSVWYSRLRAVGEVASFNDGLTVQVPALGGDITAVAYLNETLIAFRQTAIYALPGVGLDNAAGGQNFGPGNRLSSDIGAVSAESVVLTPMGLMFKSRKGWYLLDRGWNTKYIGADVSKFDAETVNAAHVLEQGHQVRFVTSGRILVYDYLVDAWTSWSITDAVHACVWNGTYYYLSSGNSGPMAEQTTFASGVSYGLDVEIGSVKPGGLAGFVRIDKILITGEHRGTHALRIRTAFDYEQDAAGNAVYTDEVYWTPSPGVVGSPFQVSRGTSRGRCEAIKVRITAASTAKDGTPATTEAVKLTGLALKVGFRRATLNKRLPRAQKT